MRIPPGGRAAITTALLFASLGAIAGTVRARPAPAQTACEHDQCGQLTGAICVTSDEYTGCDQLSDGTCKTYSCKGVKKP